MTSIGAGQLSGGNPPRGRVENDFYATPKEATIALFQKESFSGNVWEPACGDGAMSEIIKQYNPVVSTDLIDRGYGEYGIDFLDKDTTLRFKGVFDNIIINPAF